MSPSFLLPGWRALRCGGALAGFLAAASALAIDAQVFNGTSNQSLYVYYDTDSVQVGSPVNVHVVGSVTGYGYEYGGNYNRSWEGGNPNFLFSPNGDWGYSMYGYPSIDRWMTITPTQDGIFRVGIMLSSYPSFEQAHAYINFSAYVPGAVITSATSVSRNQGQDAAYQITATNSPTSFGASSLPNAASVNTGNGYISGRLNNSGTASSTISAANGSGGDSQTLTWNITAFSINPSATATPSSTPLGASVTLTRAGTANFGIAWTENVIWKPNGQAEVLGNMPLGSMSYTPASVGSYSYQFRIIDAYSNYQDQWISFTVVDGTAPSVPSGLTASNITTSSFTLGWNASTDDVGVTGYEVFRNGTSLGTTSSLSMSITGLSLNTAYGMTVRARDAAGNWSAQSATLNVTTGSDTSAPSVPAGLSTSSVGSSSFTLSWSASSDNIGVTGYEVFRGGTSLGTTSSLSLSVTGLAPSTTYGMTVRARDAAGNWSAQSATLNVTTTADTAAPSVPSGLSAGTITTNSFTLSWSASSDNIGVTGYEVFRGGTSLGTTSSLSLSVTGLAPSATYGMTVRARDAAGNWSAQSAALNVTTAADTSAPSTPIGLNSSAVASDSFTLTWGASTDNVGVTGYEVRRDGTSLGTTASLSMGITGLTPNTTYAMTVRARDAAGNWSAWSASTSITTASSFEVFTPLP